MVFVTKITYIGFNGSDTIEINKSPTKEQANEWKDNQVIKYYEILVGSNNNLHLSPQLYDISLKLKDDKEESCFKIDMINFVLQMKNKYYMETNTSFTVHEREIKK
jgi:hypothetical protein